MRIGYYFGVRHQDGGEYQYACTLLENLALLPNHEFLIYYSDTHELPKLRPKSKLKYIRLPQFESPHQKLLLLFRALLFRFLPLENQSPLAPSGYWLLTTLLRFLSSAEVNSLCREKPDLIVYPVSATLSFLTPVPAVVAIHDLQHRIQPHFKEVTAHGRARQRDYLYTMITTKASSILVDSETGRKDIYRFFPETNAKIYSLPYLPPSVLTIKLNQKQQAIRLKRLNLPSVYLFYPAKFWPHKNHQNLIRALAILKERGVSISLVLTGSAKAEFSTFKKIMELVAEHNLGDQVRYLGYLPDEDLALVYKQAFALVMPTFFGPTNIPILEAWQAKIPVLCANYLGSEEQLGQAGLRFNPNSPKDIAKKIEILIKKPTLQKKLVYLGRQRLKQWSAKKLRQNLAVALKSSATINHNERHSQP